MKNLELPKAVQRRCDWLENHPLGFHQIFRSESGFLMYYKSFNGGQLAYYPRWNEFHLSLDIAPGISTDHIKVTIQGAYRLIHKIAEAEGVLPKAKIEHKIHTQKKKN
jgi:hypothetical protein